MPSDFRPPSGLSPQDGSAAGAQRLAAQQPGYGQAGAWRAPLSPTEDPSASQTSMPGGWRSHQGGPQPGDYAGGRPGEPSTRQPSATSTWADVPPAPSPSGKRPNGGEQGDDGTAADDLWDDNADLLAVSRNEYDQIARGLDEIRMLIKQSTAELEKLNQRKVLAGAKTREMEEKIETYSRQEIRASYLASSEAEMRAFMISEQREQLQAKEKAFERYQRFLMRTINVLSSLPQGGGAMGAWTANVPTWGPASSQAPAQAAPSKDQAVATLSRVIQAQEDVRQRVAQRLHDGPAQSLANVVLTAEICEKLIQSDPRRAQGELGNLKGLVNSTLQDTRKFIFELRPMTLDDLGLVPTLRRYIADVGARYQVQVTLVAPQGDQRLPHQMEVPIFRVAQEALINAVQHGRATQARVTVALQPDTAVLVIEDNGTGFDVEQALTKAAARQTLGIASMQERAEMLGGWLRVESARGHGSRVELSVPVATS